ncbi:MAG: hypothetical protein J6R94_03330, partial [Agathobacter sp.]|nr:hypothetical protein [Agathobacter sp.]
QSTVNAITMTGVVTNIGDAYTGEDDYKNATVTIQVGDDTQTILCFRIVNDDLEVLGAIAEGDTIKVTGKVTNYNGTIEFIQGSTFENVVVEDDSEDDSEEGSETGSETGSEEGTEGEENIPEKGDNFLPMFVILFAGAAFVAVAAYGKKKNA